MDIFAHLEEKHICLDREQKAAVCHERGPLLVIAVPGSGKTTVLVSRVARLLATGLAQPGNILTVTFNRAAARDMQTRFRSLFGEVFPQSPRFSTLHAFCYQVLRNAGTPLPQIDESARMHLIRNILRTQMGPGAHIVPEEDILNASNALSYIKNRMLAPEDYAGHGLSVPFPAFAALYREAMEARGQMDFDDMLLKALALLEDPAILAPWQRTFTHILVDEAQDLSPVQHKLLEKLAARAESLFLVGDEDQSIYSFRGADPEALLSFSKVYPGGRVQRMQTNYRSLPEIVRRADDFIRINTARYPKTMTADRRGTARVEAHAFPDKQAQYRFILETLDALPAAATACVLYRSHLSAVPLADLLLREGRPFSCRESGKFFFTHPITQDLRALLELALDPSRRDCFEAVYYKLNAYLSRETCRRALQAPAHLTVWEALMQAADLPPYQRTRLAHKAQIFAEAAQLPPAQAIDRLFSEGEYELYLTQSPALGMTTQAALAQWSALRAMAEGLSTVAGFLDRLDFLEGSLPDWEKLAQPGAPVLSTVHGAKGLEFDQVFVIDLVENQFPTAGADLAEEARLFYVAITRARSVLHLSYALPTAPSPFLTRLFPPKGAPKEKRKPTRPPLSRQKSLPQVDFTPYPPGQTVRHAQWGPGVVEATDEASGRIQIRFASGTRTLSLALCLEKGLLFPEEIF